MIKTLNILSILPWSNFILGSHLIKNGNKLKNLKSIYLAFCKKKFVWFNSKSVSMPSIVIIVLSPINCISANWCLSWQFCNCSSLLLRIQLAFGVKIFHTFERIIADELIHVHFTIFSFEFKQVNRVALYRIEKLIKISIVVFSLVTEDSKWRTKK